MRLKAQLPPQHSDVSILSLSFSLFLGINLGRWVRWWGSDTGSLAGTRRRKRRVVYASSIVSASQAPIFDDPHVLSLSLQGISYGFSLLADKVNLLESMVEPYSCDCLPLSGSSTDADVGEIARVWCDIRGSILYLAPNQDTPHKISCSWLTINQDVEVANSCPKSSRLDIDKLDELPFTISHLNKKVMDKDVVTVGYIMKPSCEEDFVKRGAFPMCPTPNRLMFVPFTFELPLSLKLVRIDMVLHKATDEIKSIDLSYQPESSSKITYSPCMQELQRHTESHSRCSVVDPLNNIYPVLDRLAIQQILLGLEGLKPEDCCAIRAPHFLQVNNFDEPDFAKDCLKLNCLFQVL
ncbi:hypothetical protein SLE2022_106300 [Rubroshorea leprosula]